MLLYGYKHLRNEGAFNADPVQELSRLYREVRKLIDPAEKVEAKPEVAKNYSEAELAHSREVLAAVRQETARLHEGDSENRQLWALFMPSCLAEIESIYRLLGTLPFDHTLGESYYDPMLPEVVRDLQQRGIAVESQGALVVPPQTWKPNPTDKDPPEIIRKSNGAFAYMTTDLATIKYRVETWGPDLILYVVDFRQGNHFQHLFATARAWGYDRVALEHVPFGTVMSKDPETGKIQPMKTREGDLTQLDHLLSEAVRRAAQVQAENSLERGEGAVNLSEEELREIHRVVGIGAVKYADLSQNRTSDYLFDWDKMMAMDGNTATYMQYAYARNRSIFRKGNEDPEALRAEPPPVLLQTPDERALAVQLLRFHEALDAAAADYRPSFITAYLWDLAKTFSGFFQNCPVLKAETPELRRSRLLLCDLTARVIQRGLDLLGIRTVERM
jgi:arginyl-tRNA synthetase